MKKHLSVVTLALALAMAAPLAAGAQDDDSFTRGVAAYEDGDYARAARLWEPLAEDGSAEAQRNLAQLYRLGLGVGKDSERAYDLYVAAAEQNSVDAQVNVAFLLLTGEGVEKDSKQAALWFAKAADQGDALAQFNLGLMYEKGVGVPRDRELARELYQLSANQGQERALARLDAIENDLPPDGGTTARRAQEEAAKEEAAAARERARQDADVRRAKDRADAKAEEEAGKSDRVEKAEVEAKTGPILMIEKIEPEPEPEAEEDTAGADPVAVAAMENAEAAFSAAPQTAPALVPMARPKPQVQAPLAAPAPAMVPAPPAAMRAPAAPQAMARPMDRIRQAEAAYARGDFTTSARLLMPLARDGVPAAQFLLGRMFNRGEGVELDHFEAYSLWRSAAANGSERAATALANFSTRFAPSELARAEQNYQALQRWLAQGGN